MWYKKAVDCVDCSGKGAKEVNLCQNCNGQGKIQEINGNSDGYSINIYPCNYCQGKGATLKDPCGTCSSKGYIINKEKVKVSIKEVK